MAFPAWPTSNGQAMLAYPWLSSSGDKFVEHGHRLAGVLIGLCSLLLAAAAWFGKSQRKIRVMTLVVLFGVIIQGLIGGLRVRLDRQTIALAHSVFGCLVFVALWLTALMTSQRWTEVARTSGRHESRVMLVLAIVYPLVCLMQYVFGGFIRHLGLLVYEHLGGAIVVSVGAILIVAVSLRSRTSAVRRAGFGVGASVMVQVAIGLAVWCTKYGFPPLGLVAVQHSMLQVVSRSFHTVAGMTVVLSGVVWGIAIFRTRPVAVCENESEGVVPAAV